MKRGDIIILKAGNNVDKQRSALIVQADLLNASEILTTTIVIPFTSSTISKSSG